MNNESRPAGKQTFARSAFRRRYETLRSLLYKNGTALQLMSDLEADLSHREYSDPALMRRVRRLLDESLLMAQELNLLSGDKFRPLYGVIEDLRKRIRTVLQEPGDARSMPLALKLDDDECSDSTVVGGKAAGLAALRRRFPGRVPDGFAVTVAAYRMFIKENRLTDRIRLLLSDLDAVTDRRQFQSRAAAIRDLIRSSPIPDPILDVIRERAASTAGAGSALWAVRSSALSEDEGFSFAGQFDSVLNVAAENLDHAYRTVLASRFTDRAILFRLHCGIREVDTPMAVLFLPMIDARAAGVIYTNDPQDPASGKMIVCAVPGLADRMVRGEQEGEVMRLSRGPAPTLAPKTRQPVLSDAGGTRTHADLPERSLYELGDIAFSAAQTFGYDMDIEWAMDQESKVWLLQGRRLRLSATEESQERHRQSAAPLFENGYTLVPGRAEGLVAVLSSPAAPSALEEGSVAVIDQSDPEYAPILPLLAALLIRHGSPVGHLAALVREFSVPCLYGLESSVRLLEPGQVISVDATRRKVYRGSRWPGLRKRVMARIATAKHRLPSGPLHGLVLALHLTDPFGSSFKAKNCRSAHDVIRFIHEMSVRTMFSLGDAENRVWKKNARRVRSSLPVKLRLLDLDGSTPAGGGAVAPEDVASMPFRALWKGISDPRLSWGRRPMPDMDGMPSDFAETVLGGSRGPRRPGDANYVLVAAHYLNLNARFSYHYAMVDAIVTPGRDNNHVHLRYRGGGADNLKRIRRARFLENVLRNFHFGVDRRGDLVTAWLRNYDQSDSERALEMLGRLMACSRQMDMFLSDDDMIAAMVRKFLEEEYTAFA